MRDSRDDVRLSIDMLKKQASQPKVTPARIIGEVTSPHPQAIRKKR